MKRYDEKYDEILNGVDTSEIDVPETKAHQAYSRMKTKDTILKITSIILIGTGAVTIYKGCTKPHEPNTAVVAEGEEPESLNYEFVLETPFTKGEEKTVVDSVNKNNSNDSSVKTKASVRMVKFFNGTLTKDDFKGMSDKEIIKEVRQYFIDVLGALSPSIEEFKSIAVGNTNKYNKDVKAVSFTLFDKNSYVYKTYLRQYDGAIINEHKSDIVKNNKSDYVINAEAYAKLGKQILADKNINVYEKALVAVTLKAHLPLFSRYLSKEYKEFYEKEFDSSYFTQAMNTFFNDYAIATDVLDADCDDKTKEEEKYKAADEKDAQSKAGSTGEEGKTTTKKGGKKEGTTSEVVSGSKQTGSTQSTTVVNKDKETTKKETTPGGKVVDEQTTNKPPKVIDEEVVEPGKDNVESGTYTEDEWNSKSSSKKETTTKQEENSSSDDREFEEILTEEEWKKYLGNNTAYFGMGQIGLGASIMPISKIFKKIKNFKRK